MELKKELEEFNHINEMISSPIPAKSPSNQAVFTPADSPIGKPFAPQESPAESVDSEVAAGNPGMMTQKFLDEEKPKAIDKKQPCPQQITINLSPQPLADVSNRNCLVESNGRNCHESNGRNCHKSNHNCCNGSHSCNNNHHQNFNPRNNNFCSE